MHVTIPAGLHVNSSMSLTHQSTNHQDLSRAITVISNIESHISIAYAKPCCFTYVCESVRHFYLSGYVGLHRNIVYMVNVVHLFR